MSTLADLDENLQEFEHLPYHFDAKLADKLAQVQSFQRARINDTHQALFCDPANVKMAQYFLNRLYGGESLDILVNQLRRLVPKAQKVERVVPTAVINTGTTSIQTAILATKLDMNLATWLIDNDLAVTADNMHKSYIAVNEADKRREQIQTLKDVSYAVDKHVNSFMVKSAFKLTKSTAYRHNFSELYDFVNEGFEAMKPLRRVADFIEPFCEREMQIITEVHAPDNPSTVV